MGLRSARTSFAARRRSEDGASALELVIVFPAVLLIFLIVIQTGAYFYARSLALSAAQSGVDKVRTTDGSVGEGNREAKSFTSRSGGNMLKSVTVRATRDQTQASVTVRGQSLSLVPGIKGLKVEQTATQPVERFTQRGDLQ